MQSVIIMITLVFELTVYCHTIIGLHDIPNYYFLVVLPIRGDEIHFRFVELWICGSDECQIRM